MICTRTHICIMSSMLRTLKVETIKWNPPLTIVVVLQLINPEVQIITVENTPDDPRQRKPDITKAKALLRWEPTIKLSDGIPLMEDDFRGRLGIPRKKWAIISLEWWTHLLKEMFSYVSLMWQGMFTWSEFFHSLSYCMVGMTSYYIYTIMSVLIYDYRIPFVYMFFYLFGSIHKNCGQLLVLEKLI